MRAGLDPRIEAACLKMMAKNPAERFASLSAVAEELATILRIPAPKVPRRLKSRSPQCPRSTATRRLPRLESLKHAQRQGPDFSRRAGPKMPGPA